MRCRIVVAQDRSDRNELDAAHRLHYGGMRVVGIVASPTRNAEGFTHVARTISPREGNRHGARCNALARVATLNYNVVMTVVSIRFSDEPLHRRLKKSAQRRGLALSTLAERLIDEGLRMEAHPLVMFRDGPSGRGPILVGGPEVADVIGAIVDGDVPVDQRRSRAAELMDVAEALVDAALGYYADYTDEIDRQLATRAQMAEEIEESWHRQRALLER